MKSLYLIKYNVYYQYDRVFTGGNISMVNFAVKGMKIFFQNLS
jgi:hypothetical protein